MNLICTQSWLPVRLAPSPESEMVTSLLFGETVTVLTTKDDWYQIECNHDKYHGWVSKSYLLDSVEDYQGFNKRLAVHGAYWQNVSGRMDLSPGSLIPVSGKMTHSGNVFHFCENQAFIPENTDVVAIAELFRFSPYLWGGRSLWGIDCSGLVQVAYQIVGVNMPRDAKDQAQVGEDVAFGNHKSGDLAFFEKDGRVTHTGLVCDDGFIFHASGKVRKDRLSSEGIEHYVTGKLTHNLACIRRVV
jgi:hypothetical protein